MAATWSPRTTWSRTCAPVSPVALITSWAIRAETSSFAYVSPTRCENSVSTSYGVDRRPKMIFVAIRRDRRRSGTTSKPKAIPTTTETLGFASSQIAN
ncbi:MAG: hypothetical protein ACM3WR_00255 [Solirubrobacterales bacterium]